MAGPSGAGFAPAKMCDLARPHDNIFVERLWRTVKYEDIYIKGYETTPALFDGLAEYFMLYNHERPHQHLQYRVPAKVHFND